MKNLLMLLVLANVLYYLWSNYTVDAPEPGVAIVSESDIGPPLNVARHTANGQPANAGVLGQPGEAAVLDAVVGPSCVTVGPFTEEADADTAVLESVNEGLRALARSEIGDIFVGHWVQIRNLPDDATANRMVQALQDEGLTDAYLVRTDDEGLKISLGLFGEIERAERVELQARALDMPVEITPRTREGSVYFVDIGLPPGRGAESIIERYGEDRVALRGAARCPE